MDRIAITANPLRPPPAGFLAALLRAFTDHGAEVRIDEEAASLTTHAATDDADSLAEWATLVVVVGGDGSVLRAAHSYRNADCPLLGVNSGRLGFLSFSAATDAAETAAGILEHRFVVSERRLLQAEIWRQNAREPAAVLEALNEITVSRRAISRMIHIEASLQGEILNTYYADGLIVATPTGSTAYSMSAGGPVVAPESRVLVLTPICPHSLNVRSLVVPDELPVELRVLGLPEEEPVMLTNDGETPLVLEYGDVIRIVPASRVVRLALPEDHSFYGRMREKLRWQGSNV